MANWTPSIWRIIFFLSLMCSFGWTASARGGEASCQHRIPEPNRSLLANEDPPISLEATKGYLSNSDLEKEIKNFSTRCRKISNIYSIGKSFNGVDLWVIEITNNPREDEPKPAFKYIGNVHGNEPLGRELLMRLANWICDNYEKDPLAKLIVENMRLHILPSMNPDGFSLRRRGNANNVDLNRDFPDQFFPQNNDFKRRQPETRAVMNWIKNKRFVASASLHGGALVANYPWDGTKDSQQHYEKCPDDDTFKYLARIYSTSHYNMSESTEFSGGITNGAEWYPIYGGMQDWNYIYGQCFELTLEVSDNKWPLADELPTLWDYNKRSLLNLAASVLKPGIHGKIFSSDGKALSGSVSVAGINFTAGSDARHGDYYRILYPPGEYNVSATMAGYKSKTTSVVLREEASTSLDFILEPLIVESSKNAKIEDCKCDRIVVLEVLRGLNTQVYFLMVSVMGFLGFVLFRGRLSRLRQRPLRSNFV